MGVFGLNSKGGASWRAGFVMMVLMYLAVVNSLVLYEIMNPKIEADVYEAYFKRSAGMCFIKDLDSKIVDVNDNYRYFIKKAFPELDIDVDFIGTRGEVFGLKAVEKFVAHDKMVLNKNDLMVFDEDMPGKGRGYSYKNTIVNSLGNPIGIIGVWIEKK